MKPSESVLNVKLVKVKTRSLIQYFFFPVSSKSHLIIVKLSQVLVLVKTSIIVSKCQVLEGKVQIKSQLFMNKLQDSCFLFLMEANFSDKVKILPLLEWIKPYKLEERGQCVREKTWEPCTVYDYFQFNCKSSSIKCTVK